MLLKSDRTNAVIKVPKLNIIIIVWIEETIRILLSIVLEVSLENK